MTTVYDVPATELIKKVSDKLKEMDEIQPPEWAAYVKTGVNRDLPPDDPDWWYIRCASLLRRVYIDGPVGVSRLKTVYGGKKNNGSKPHHFEKASGAVLREALRQLEGAGFIASSKEGRSITPKGQSFLDNTAFEVKTKLVEQTPALAKY
jgi:small subunit ribosomal protein S19e